MTKDQGSFGVGAAHADPDADQATGGAPAHRYSAGTRQALGARRERQAAEHLAGVPLDKWPAGQPRPADRFSMAA